MSNSKLLRELLLDIVAKAAMVNPEMSTQVLADLRNEAFPVLLVEADKLSPDAQQELAGALISLASFITLGRPSIAKDIEELQEKVLANQAQFQEDVLKMIKSGEAKVMMAGIPTSCPQEDIIPIKKQQRWN